MGEIIVVSPSGKFYGSEQVLYDYVSHTRLHFVVKAPANGGFITKLSQLRKFPVEEYKKVPLLYLGIAWLCLREKHNVIYINEGGHVRYAILLAKLFPSSRFVVHVRILEDTIHSRWSKNNIKNLLAISISKFIKLHLPFPSKLIYDPYPFTKKITLRGMSSKKIFSIGVVGRISFSKGVKNILCLLDEVKKNHLENEFQFFFFGDIAKEMEGSTELLYLREFSNVKIMGFFDDKDAIYNSVDCIVHGAESEPLGRIFLESIDYCRPFIGIDSGGIGEISTLLSATEFMINPNVNSTGKEFFKKLVFVRDNFDSVIGKMAGVKKRAVEIFSIQKYTRNINSLLLNRTDINE